MSPKTCFATEFPSGERSEQTFHKRCVNQEQFSGMEEGQLAALAKLAKLAIFDKRRGPDMMRAKFARGSSAEVEHLEHLEHLGRRHQYAHPITSVTTKLVSPLTPDS
jgi:hypothetical protein